jgi:plastocyanin
VDASKAGKVTGRVVIEGPVPANLPIQMSADPFCSRQNADGAAFESFLVDDGGLRNVFVYVKDGLGGYYFEVPTDAVRLDQEGCRYRPHVLGMRVGQPIEISNSDDTLHTVHAVASVNREFNLSQPLKNLKEQRTFTAREVMVPFKCNVHNWMQAYVGVLDHPYFAVTADGGAFEIELLPAGTYTVEAWHEKLGTRVQSVTLKENESKEITFSFKSAE